jgi:hypothetical protein
MYNSPITLYETAVQTIMEERENAIFAKVQSSLEVDVDKEELLRALQYDRDQYDRGFADGYMNAKQELVRCKDCKHWTMGYCINFAYYSYAPTTGEDDFCSYGERKDK